MLLRVCGLVRLDVEIGTRSLGQCSITTHIAATRMIHAFAVKPRAFGKGATMPQMRTRRSSPVEGAGSSYNVRQVEYWFRQLRQTGMSVLTTLRTCPSIPPLDAHTRLLERPRSLAQAQ
jgi:hypothetical protein